MTTKQQFFPWKPDSYSIGVDPMDDQHQQIVAIMNLLFDRNAERAPHQELCDILKDLVEVTVKHFSEEEKHMASIKYPGLEEHKGVHTKLLKELDMRVGLFRDGGGEIPDSLFHFLKQWLRGHILSVDREYSGHS